MTTRAALVTAIRSELNDAAATKLWEDALLARWIAEALRDYSERLPREALATWTSTAGQASYTLPTDFAQALRLEHPSGFLRLLAPLVGGDVTEASESPRQEGERQLSFDVYGGSAILEPAPDASGETIALRYLAAYAEPAADGDLLATPSRDDELLVWFVCARALRWIDTDEAKRMRFEQRRGVSAAAAAASYRDSYQDAMQARMRRLPRRRRLIVREG